MIRILPVASGSTGNCMLVEIDGHRILIDLGVTAKKLCSALKANQLAFGDVEAVLITHTHSDHIKGLDVCMRKITAPLYMSSISKETLANDRASVLHYDMETEIVPGVKVTAIRTSHDCPGSMGFKITSDQSSLGYITDLGEIPDSTIELLYGADAVVIEANHDEAMLMSGRYPAYLKKRILSDHGHLSNEACAGAVARIAEKGTKHFFLAHLSQENNRPSLALECVRNVISGMDIEIDVLPVYGEEMISV